MIHTITNYIHGQRGVPINTIIGGVASTISTKALLATKLGIAESEIRIFEIVGSDVHANIKGTYILSGYNFQNNTSITSFIDMGDLCTIVGRYTFENCINLRSVRFNRIIQLRNSSFRNCPLDILFDIQKVTTSEQYSLNGCKMTSHPFSAIFTDESGFVFSNNTEIEYINLPNLYFIGQVEFQGLSNLKEIRLDALENLPTSLNHFSGLVSCNLISMKKFKSFNSNSIGAGSVFANLKLNCVIEVHIALATANAGAPAAQILWAKNNRASIVNFYDDSGNYVSTL